MEGDKSNHELLDIINNNLSNLVQYHIILNYISSETLILNEIKEKNKSGFEQAISMLNNIIKSNNREHFNDIKKGAKNQELLDNLIEERIKSNNNDELSVIEGILNTTKHSNIDLEKLILSLKEIVQRISNHFHHIKERRPELDINDANVFLELKKKKASKATLQRIQTIANMVLGITIDAFVEDDNSDPVLDVDNFLIQVNGYGVKEALRIIFDYEIHRPKVVLIEEPELHLHPSLEMNLMRYLKEISAECQIFMTTHSTNFIDTGDVKNVYLVSKNESTTVRALNTEEAASLIPQELGLRLSSLFMYDKLIFVEGKLDEEILRTWTATLGVNLSQHNIGFVTMEGVFNQTYYAAEATLDFLSKKQIQTWFLIDRDERDQQQIDRIKQPLSGKSNVRVLNKREIENYLFVPRAIAQFLRDKGQISGLQATTEGITEEMIQQQITTCVETCKQQVIEKRIAARLPALRFDREVLFPKKPKAGDLVSRSIQELDRLTALLSDAKAQFPAIAQEEASAIEARWPTEKMNLVQGDVLLDAVFRVYGLRFNKSRDGAALAALMTDEEIDQEIKAFFKTITQ